MAERRVRSLIRTGLVVAAVGVWLSAAAPAVGAAGDDVGGVARYSYAVEGLAYDSSASLTGGRAETVCTPNETSFWSASQQGGSTDSATGDGKMKIGERGTTGRIDAAVDVNFTLRDAFHQKITSCDRGFATGFETTNCPQQTVTELVVLTGKIRGGVGTRITLTLDIVTVGGGWALDSFTCVEALIYPHGDPRDCFVKTQLRTLTRKHPEIPFNCNADKDTTVPPGYDSYSAVSDIQGTLLLERTKFSN
jgi:hypothetical protein